MLALKNITKQFQAQTVLKDISLEIDKKEMISVMGKSGSGKSTLLGIIAGLVKPDSGHVLFEGSHLETLDEERLAEHRLFKIGLIFQDFKLIPSLSTFNNILLGIYPIKDISKEEKHRRILKLCEQVGLEEKINSPVTTLSGGEKQRVAIARSLVKNPGLVLADEPTGNLDSKTAEQIMQLFKRLHRESDATFVIVTHNDDIARQTERTFHIHDGEIK